jgi:short-subunit dehydrogenase
METEKHFKTVLITGCSSGIGYLTALKFAKNGFFTYASVRNINSDGARKLMEVAGIEKLPLEVIEIDVDSIDSIVNGMSTIREHTHSIDILINNAGFGFLGPIEEFSIEEVKQQYETNLFGVLRMIKQIVPMMRKKHSGHIINISSINGLLSFPLYGVYSSSKFALETLSEVLDFELSKFGIKVSIVEPGSFLTNFTKNKKVAESAVKPESPYIDLLQTFSNRYEKKVDTVKYLTKPMNPQRVAEVIFKAATSSHPKLRYLIGIDAHIFYYMHKVLPYSLWKTLLRKVYNW